MNERDLLRICPPEWVATCDHFAERMVEKYQRHPSSLSLHGIEGDVARLSMAKQTEVIGAQELGLDPGVALDWRVHSGDEGDPGHDCIAHGVKWDIKQAGWFAAYLTWSARKGLARLVRADFDRLMMIRADSSRFAIVGWITKGEFVAKHQLAGPGHKLPDVGTLYVHRDELHDPRLLPYPNLSRAFLREMEAA